MSAKDLQPSKLIGDEPEKLEQIHVHKSNINMFLEKSEIIDSRVYAALNHIHYND